MKLCLTTVKCTWYTVGIQNKGSKAFVTKLTFIELLELCWVYTTHIALWLHIALWFPHGFLLHGVTVNNLGFSHIRGARTHTFIPPQTTIFVAKKCRISRSLSFQEKSIAISDIVTSVGVRFLS